MSTQNEYRKRYASINKDWKESIYIYRELVNKQVTKNTHVLDIGCGHNELLKDVYAKTFYSYGLDPDPTALKKNTFIKHKRVGTVENIPFPNNQFNLVVMAWVVEHLNDPKTAFSEIFRVLKPKGKLIFLTPNAWNYNTWFIRMIPNLFHPLLTEKLYQRKKGDTYPVKYKLNTVNKIRKTLIPLGFKENKIIYNGDPSYISFSDTLFKISYKIESIFNLKFFNFLKVHMICIFEK